MAQRRSLDETRRRILDAAAEMVSEAGYSLRSADISLIDACRRAGLGTAGSGYKIWATQDDFQRDLVRHALLMETERDEAAGRLVEAIAELGPDPSLSDLIRVAGNENAAAVVGASWFARLIALWLAAATDSVMRQEQIESQRKLLASLGETFGELLAAFGREFRPPFTIEMLTLAIAAEMNGIGCYCAYEEDDGATVVDRPTGPGGQLERWHLVSCVVEALVEAFTRRVAPSAEADR